MPERIQLRRTKGYRKPEGAIVVARPSKWGNPFPVDGDWSLWTAVALGYQANRDGRRAAMVALHRAWLAHTPIVLGPNATDTSGGSIEFDDGTVATMACHVAGLGAFMASICDPPTVPPDRPSLSELRGHDLACWCPLEDEHGNRVPCHADVLLDLANRDEP
jgi:hypothetical protein